MFKAIEADLARFQDDPRAMASQMELMASQAGLNKTDIEAILTQSTGRSTVELEKIMRSQVGSKLPTQEEIAGEQTVVGGLSVDAAEAMKDAKIAIQGADEAFNMLSTTTEVVRTSLDAFDGALANAIGTMAGLSTGVQMGAQATGVMDVVSSLADITSIAADISRFRRGGGFGRLLSRGRAAPQAAAQGARGLVSRAVQGTRGLATRAGAAVGTGPAMATAGASRGLGVATPFTRAGRELMRARSLTTGGFGGALKGVSKKVPLLGAAIAGGLELAESGDKSRAAASAAGAGLGGWGGAAAGAAIGTMIFPGVGTAIGGLLGGVLGAWGGESAAKAIHDEFDPEFVANQQRKEQEAAQAERDAKTFKGTPEELRAEAEAMAIQQMQLDEQTRLNTNIERMIDILNQPGYYEGERVSGFGTGTFHTREAASRFDERYDDAWEQKAFLNAYHGKYMEIKHGGGN